ncbi:MAG TPA: hypothetical protein VFS16_04345 [Acidimicrobiia bacterium]|nr:hypothetical protein [Acidimicrobiia bacterium]
MLLGLTAALLPAPPAGAHSGGRAQLYVDSIRLEPQPEGWHVALTVLDGDSGQREPGFGVQVGAAGPGGETIGPVDLADGDNDGRYEGTVPLTAGSWTLTVDAGEIPGGARAVPFEKSWPVTLQAGRPVDVAGSRPPAGGHGAGSRAVPLILGIAAAAALSGLVTLARSRKTVFARDCPQPVRRIAD